MQSTEVRVKKLVILFIRLDLSRQEEENHVF